MHLNSVGYSLGHSNLLFIAVKPRTKWKILYFTLRKILISSISVGLVNNNKFANCGIVVPISSGWREFSLLQNQRTGCECHLAPVHSVTVFFLPEFKEAGAWRSSPNVLYFRLRKNSSQNPFLLHLHAVHGYKFMLYKCIALQGVCITRISAKFSQPHILGQKK